MEGTLLVGPEGSFNKLPVKIDSNNVADVLEIRPHTSLKEKEMKGYETGVKPGETQKKSFAICSLCSILFQNIFLKF